MLYAIVIEKAKNIGVGLKVNYTYFRYTTIRVSFSYKEFLIIRELSSFVKILFEFSKRLFSFCPS
jgi:hypothetical protein